MSSVVPVADLLHALVVVKPGVPPQIALSTSTDAGAHWALSEFRFPSEAPFYPTVFADGSSDSYLYIWGSKSPKGTPPCLTCRSAYLARVPRDRVHDRTAWEFYSFMKGDTPVWTEDPRRSYASIADADDVDVLAAVYHPWLKRYLIALATRTGYQIVDAPQAWGPYSTVWSSDKWDEIEPDAKLRLVIPFRWLNPDGQTLWAAYSSGDVVAVVRGTLTVPGTAGR